MTDDQHGEGTPRSGGRWDPLPQGDYDDGATAFVKLPEGGIDALLASGGEDRVNAAFEAPPTTSEQVLDPSTYVDGAEPAVPVPEPAADGKVEDRGVYGAAGVLLTLVDRIPVADWEDAIGRMAAHRLRARAVARLADGTWDGDDLEEAIAAAEARTTARQRVLIWEALTGDPVLSALAAGS